MGLAETSSMHQNTTSPHTRPTHTPNGQRQISAMDGQAAGCSASQCGSACTSWGRASCRCHPCEGVLVEGCTGRQQ